MESRPEEWPVLPFKEHIPKTGSGDSWTPTTPSLSESDTESSVTAGCFLGVSVLGRPSAGWSLRWLQRCCLDTVTQVGGVRPTSEPRLSPTHWNIPCLASEGEGITKIKRRHLFFSSYVVPYSLELIRAKQTAKIPWIFAFDNKNTKWDICELIDCLSPPTSSNT